MRYSRTVAVDPNRPPLELSGVRRETEEAPAPAGEEAIPAAEAAAEVVLPACAAMLSRRRTSTHLLSIMCFVLPF